MIYDVIIIGAGPAGITASVYAARKRMNVLVLSDDVGGQTAWSGDVENYTGYQFVTGQELAEKFEEHMKHYQIPLHEGEHVIAIQKDHELITVQTEKDSYQAKTVIIASGKRSRELGVPGEKEYKNKGLTYCATCDGPLFSDKAVAVIGGGNSGLDAALQLLKIAKHIYLIENGPALRGDAIMREKVTTSDTVTVLCNAQVQRIIGEQFVTGIEVMHQGKKQTLAVEGIFVEIGLIPNSECAPNVEKNDGGELKVNAYNETNVPGIFAAGDVTDVPEKQIIIAAGEGSKALLCAFHYLATRA